MSLRTPLSKVRGLGSAREGTSHFWWQRVTSVALIFLTLYAVWLAMRLIGADHRVVRAMLASPLHTVPLLLLIVAGIYHMWLGMRTIIEDYVHGEGRRLLWLMLNTAFAIVVGLLSALAALKLFLG